MTSVLCHTTMSLLLEILCRNPIEVLGHGLLVVQGARINGPHAKHMQREFESPSGMDVAMLGPSGQNG
jgi:hypothetical protein